MDEEHGSKKIWIIGVVVIVLALAAGIWREDASACKSRCLWESSRVTMIAKADKSRLTVRGVKDGHDYLVKQTGSGWWIEPAPERVPSRKREIRNATLALTDHLDALAAEGFSFEPLPKGNVPPCRF